MNLNSKTKMVILLIYVFITLSTLILNAQPRHNIYCAKQLTSATSQVNCNSIASDASGNTYATGYFTGTFDFDPGPGIFNLTADKEDIFICKFGSDGDLIWVKKFGSPAKIERGRSIAIYNSGHICIAGYCSEITDFDTGPGVIRMAQSGVSGMFLCKLDSHGNLIWVKQSGGESITTDASDNIYATGNFIGKTDFDPGVGTFIMNAAKGSGFITKLNSSGDFIWAKQMGDKDAVGLSIALDSKANIYSVGSFGSTADFDPGANVYKLRALWESTYISKLDSSGNFIWAKQLSSSGDFPYSIVVDSIENVFIAGTFQDAGDFDPGQKIYSLIAEGADFDQDAFITKLDVSGNFVWAKQIGGFELQQARSLSIDNYSNLYITGYFADTTDFNPGPDNFIIVAPSIDSVNQTLSSYICKLDSGGNFVWAIAPENNKSKMFSLVKIDNLGNLYADPSVASKTDSISASHYNILDSTANSSNGLNINRSGPIASATSANNMSQLNEIIVFPNPTSGEVNIVLLEPSHLLSVMVRDILGNKISNYSFEDTRKVYFELEGPPGLYFIELMTTEGKISYVSVIKN